MFRLTSYSSCDTFHSSCKVVYYCVVFSYFKTFIYLCIMFIYPVTFIVTAKHEKKRIYNYKLQQLLYFKRYNNRFICETYSEEGLKNCRHPSESFPSYLRQKATDETSICHTVTASETTNLMCTYNVYKHSFVNWCVFSFVALFPVVSIVLLLIFFLHVSVHFFMHVCCVINTKKP